MQHAIPFDRLGTGGGLTESEATTLFARLCAKQHPVPT